MSVTNPIVSASFTNSSVVAEVARELILVFTAVSNDVLSLSPINFAIFASFLASSIDNLSPKIVNRFFDYPGELGSDGKDKITSLIRNISSSSLKEMYISSISLFDNNLGERSSESLFV